jgi:hypothetical protein
MTSTWLFRFAILVAISVLVLIASGSAVTANVLEPLASSPGGLFGQAGHQISSVVAAVLAMILAIWLIAAGGESRSLGWVVALLVLAVGGVGTPSLMEKFGPGLPILHACLAHLLFASTAAAVVLTSPGWSKGPDTVIDAGWPSLRSLSTITPILVFAQIALGAAFRHKGLGVLPHIAGAIIVTLAILMTGMFVNQQYPDHRPLKSASATMMTVVFCQVFLGIAALTVRMINSTDTPQVVLVTGAHVVTGALALGATVALSMQIRRHVLPRPKQVEA